MSLKASHILFTSTYAQPYLSGITDYIFNITEFLAKTHFVTLISFRHDEALPKIEVTNNVRQIRIKPHFKISKGFINIFYPILIWQEIKNHDHIFINSPQVEGIFVAIIAKLLGKRLTVIYHCELVFESGILLQTIAFLANILTWLTLALCDKVITYTQDYADSSPNLRFWSKKLMIVSPPVSLASPDQKYVKLLATKKANDFPIIGFSGRVSREKGLDYLLEAIYKLRQTHPRIQLWCAGTYGAEVAGETGYFSEIQKEILNQQLPIKFLGRLSKPELAAFYKSISVLVLPSINKTEAFGMVQAEALLAGTPVVTTDLPGVRACVKLTGYGAIVQPKNSEALVEAISKVLKNQPPSIKISEVARNFFGTQKTQNWFQAFVTAN